MTRPDNTLAALEPDRFELREPLPYDFTCGRRDFLAATAAGLLIFVFDGASPAQRGGGAESSTLGARLHLGEDGTVTVLTGKVEEGQGARTEVAIAAAEELRVPVDRIRVQTADTASTPNDGTTAGSRTTPGTIPLVRRAAATARQLLLTSAADQWRVDRSKLTIVNGAVADGERKLSYADLARSPELAAAYQKTLPADIIVTPAGDWRVMGTPHHRLNADGIVTGAHRFPSDIVRPGMLYGCVLRPPSMGASLESAPLDQAKQMPGVVAVRDGDFAGCAAPTRYAARKAVAKLAETASWRTQDHPPSAKLFEYLKEHAQGEGRAQGRGALEDGLNTAHQRLQATYRIPYVQHAPMETRSATAEWTGGNLTVWTGTSNPFSVRDQLAQAFHIEPRRVRVIVPDFGGGFGGKHTGEAALEVARLSREAGRPVNIQWTRAEEFMWAYSRPAALIEVQAGLDAKGALVAWDFANYNSGTAALETPYRVANVRTRYIPCESPLRQGSYRCLAGTANNFARECFMDELASAARVDPLEFRLAHLDNARIKEVLIAAAERFGWRERRNRRRPNTGIGLACGTEKGSVVAACVEAEVDRATGVPRLLEICEAFECGPILNPANHRAQVEGAIIMGLGAALREELHFENGRLTNGTFAKYSPPRFRDVPKIDLVLLDKKDQEPAGAGETPIMAVAPALANAVFDAAGERIRAMPVRLRQS